MPNSNNHTLLAAALLSATTLLAASLVALGIVAAASQSKSPLSPSTDTSDVPDFPSQNESWLDSVISEQESLLEKLDFAPVKDITEGLAVQMLDDQGNYAKREFSPKEFQMMMSLAIATGKTLETIIAEVMLDATDNVEDVYGGDSAGIKDDDPDQDGPPGDIPPPSV
jgi:hypothetical protein